jgi:hypothetical protein
VKRKFSTHHHQHAKGEGVKTGRATANPRGPATAKSQGKKGAVGKADILMKEKVLPTVRLLSSIVMLVLKPLVNLSRVKSQMTAK